MHHIQGQFSRAPSRSHKKGSIRQQVTSQIGRSLRSVAGAAVSAVGGRTRRSDDRIIDTDSLAVHLMKQFGELVNRHELPVPVAANQRKLEQAKMKVRAMRCNEIK